MHLDQRAEETSTLIKFFLGAEKYNNNSNTTSPSVCGVLGIDRLTMCNLLSSECCGLRTTRMTPSRQWRTCVLTSRVCGPVSCSSRERFHRLTSGTVTSDLQTVRRQRTQGDRRATCARNCGFTGCSRNRIGLDSHDAHERCAKWLTEPRTADKGEKPVARQKRLSAAQVEPLYSASSRIRVYLNSWVRLARRM